MKEVGRVEEFLKDPREARVSREGTVQVQVPKVIPAPTPILVAAAVDGDGGGLAGAGGGDVGDEAIAVSAHTKRVALQKKAAAAMVAAEDYARRFESGDIAVGANDPDREEHGQSNMNIMCRMCFLGENEGSERARRMLSCKSCGKKYHRSCLKSWAQHRDLFHWSSWTCPSCRICEVCRRTGDPNKFMFCKRCDGAYHCYCQHPPHKNVSSGPYLCPKHTRCHSCGSNVPGNGLSVRWFLGYTCCDACGRLFVKGNYCPVCLKVYRDSESTPMVCCDICQRWVHCQCDGISDEQYLQFQVDGNLQYKCATCRGECYQVKDLEDAVRELWRRRDMSDRELIASLRAAAGLPTQEEIFSISPYSDDEENGPMIGRSLKFSLKGLLDKSPKKNKEYGKKYSNKKYNKKKGYQTSVVSIELHEGSEGQHDARSDGCSLGDEKNDELQSQRNEALDISSPVVGILSHAEGICSTNQPITRKHKFVEEVMVSDEDRTPRVVKIKSNKPHGPDSEDAVEQQSSKLKTGAKKLVINLGPRKINVTNSQKTDASTCRKEDLTTSNGFEDTSQQQRMSDKFTQDRYEVTNKSADGDTVDRAANIRGLKIAGKFGKVRSEDSDIKSEQKRNSGDGFPQEQMRISFGKRSTEVNKAAVVPKEEVPTSRGEKEFSGNQLEGRIGLTGEGNDDHDLTPTLHSSQRDSKTLLKFKLKKPTLENQNSQASQFEEEKSFIKGQRSKRKRPSPLMEKSSFNEDEDVLVSHKDSLMDEIMNANWILKKLGKDAIGKRVEVHQPSDNSWHKGVVTDIIGGSSTLSVTLDDGRLKKLELGKQGVRFIPQKQKRSKA